MLGAGFDPAEIERYQAGFADKNPWMHMNVTMPVGMVGVSDQALNQRDLFKTEFYNDWLRHQENVIGGPAMICYRSDTRFVAMAAACRANGYDDKLYRTKKILEAIAPHIRRAIELSVAFAQGAMSTAPVINALEHGLILLRRSGSVADVNRSAEAFLRSRPGLVIDASQKLVAATNTLQAFVARTVRAVSAMDFTGLPDPLSHWGADQSRVVLHAHIFPEVSCVSFPGALWSDPVSGAIVITNPHSMGATKSSDGLSKMIGATPAEARLAGALLQGELLGEYADRMNLSRHTVRNQMRSLLQKSGTRTQADFVRQMLAAASPFQTFDM